LVLPPCRFSFYRYFTYIISKLHFCQHQWKLPIIFVSHIAFCSFTSLAFPTYINYSARSSFRPFALRCAPSSKKPSSTSTLALVAFLKDRCQRLKPVPLAHGPSHFWFRTSRATEAMRAFVSKSFCKLWILSPPCPLGSPVRFMHRRGAGFLEIEQP